MYVVETSPVTPSRTIDSRSLSKVRSAPMTSWSWSSPASLSASPARSASLRSPCSRSVPNPTSVPSPGSPGPVSQCRVPACVMYGYNSSSVSVIAPPTSVSVVLMAPPRM